MLDPSNEFVAKVCLSLIREYLTRHKLCGTLDRFNSETALLIPQIGFYGSRRALGHDLGLEGLMRLNKDSTSPLSSLFEVLVKCFLQDREYLLRSTSYAHSCYYSSLVESRQRRESKLSPSNRPKQQSQGSQTCKLKCSQAKNQFGTNHHHTMNPYPYNSEFNSTTKTKTKTQETQKHEQNSKKEYPRELGETRPVRSQSRTSFDQESQDEEKADDSITNYDSANWNPGKINSGLRPILSGSKGSNNDGRSFSPEVKSHLSLGENLLESKRNLLAKVSLSREENELRQKRNPAGIHSESEVINNTGVGGSIKTSKSNTTSSSSSSTTTTITTDQGFKLRNLESLSSQSATPRKFKSHEKESFFVKLGQEDIQSEFTESCGTTRIIDSTTWKNLKQIVLGEHGILHDGWKGQGFSFSNPQIPYGLVQKRGGPCGVLAAIEAILLRNLIFGSTYSDSRELPIVDFDPREIDETEPGFTSSRTKALIDALAEILWRCKDPNGGSILVVLNGSGAFGVGSEVRVFQDLGKLKIFIEGNLYRFDCIGHVYSIVLTRGIERVQEDMDFTNSPLLGQHGYCTQELINLMTTGSAISNTFDNNYVLDEKVLKGIKGSVDIGLLSLFEHYNSCKVGSFLKNPKFPLWIVCSESHYSLLFSTDSNLIRDNRPPDNDLIPTTSKLPFDLYYYDGLAHQDKIIRLTLRSASGSQVKGIPAHHHIISRRKSGDRELLGNEAEADDELVPPLEKCIRTKWTGVHIDWNDTEPIL